VTAEFDLRAGDDTLAEACSATQTTIKLAHDAGGALALYPPAPFWLVLDPDNIHREDVLVTALAGQVATVTRNFSSSPPGTGVAHREGARARLAVNAGCLPEPWHGIGNAGEPAFQGTWVNGVNVPVLFGWTPDGHVWLRGTAKLGALPSVMFTLPAGYRPDHKAVFAVDSNAGYAQCVVQSTGDVEAHLGSNTAWSVDGVQFLAMQ